MTAAIGDFTNPHSIICAVAIATRVFILKNDPIPTATAIFAIDFGSGVGDVTTAILNCLTINIITLNPLIGAARTPPTAGKLRVRWHGTSKSFALLGAAFFSF